MWRAFSSLLRGLWAILRPVRPRKVTLRPLPLAPYVAVVADLAVHAAPEELARRYRDGVEALRRYWRGTDDLPIRAVGQDSA